MFGLASAVNSILPLFKGELKGVFRPYSSFRPPSRNPANRKRQAMDPCLRRDDELSYQQGVLKPVDTGVV